MKRPLALGLFDTLSAVMLKTQVRFSSGFGEWKHIGSELVNIVTTEEEECKKVGA